MNLVSKAKWTIYIYPAASDSKRWMHDDKLKREGRRFLKNVYKEIECFQCNGILLWNLYLCVNF